MEFIDLKTQQQKISEQLEKNIKNGTDAWKIYHGT